MKKSHSDECDDRDKKLEELIKKFSGPRSNRTTPRGSAYNSQQSSKKLASFKVIFQKILIFFRNFKEFSNALNVRNLNVVFSNSDSQESLENLDILKSPPVSSFSMSTVTIYKQHSVTVRIQTYFSDTFLKSNCA